MSGSSERGSTLGERIRRKSEEREREIAALVEGQARRLEERFERRLQQLERRLSASASAALSTIERDTEAALARKDELLKRAWRRPLVTGIAIAAGLGLGSWGLAQWQWRQIQGRIETRAGLELDIREYRQTLRELEGQARGVRIVERANGTFAVLPAGSEMGWTVGGRPAVKLPD